MNPYKIIRPIFFVLLPHLSVAQAFDVISTRWNNSFAEWNFYMTKDEQEGSLSLRWLMQNDWTEWDYRIGEIFGTIKRRWKDNPNEWELRGQNRIISARTLWNGDFREWRITDNNTTLTFKSKWSNRSDEWELRDRQYGNFYLYTRYELDARDWIIVDEMNKNFIFEMKMMLVFLAIFHASPKI
jgi:hypothetical protein